MTVAVLNYSCENLTMERKDKERKIHLSLGSWDQWLDMSSQTKRLLQVYVMEKIQIKKEDLVWTYIDRRKEMTECIIKLQNVRLHKYRKIKNKGQEKYRCPFGYDCM